MSTKPVALYNLSTADPQAASHQQARWYIERKSWPHTTSSLAWLSNDPAPSMIRIQRGTTCRWTQSHHKRTVQVTLINWIANGVHWRLSANDSATSSMRWINSPESSSDLSQHPCYPGSIVGRVVSSARELPGVVASWGRDSNYST